MGVCDHWEDDATTFENVERGTRRAAGSLVGDGGVVGEGDAREEWEREAERVETILTCLFACLILTTSAAIPRPEYFAVVSNKLPSSLAERMARQNLASLIASRGDELGCASQQNSKNITRIIVSPQWSSTSFCRKPSFNSYSLFFTLNDQLAVLRTNQFGVLFTL